MGEAGIVECVGSLWALSAPLRETVFALPCMERFCGGGGCVRGVETVRFCFDGASATVGVETPGRGGLGGGIFSIAVVDFSITTLWGLMGKAGRGSPVRSGVICPLTEPFMSTSLSRLLLAIVGWSGGGSKPIWMGLALATESLDRGGLPGTEGGESSSTLAEPLLGGLLKGDTFSGRFVFTSIVAASTAHEFLDFKTGFSRCIGGGVSVSRWRRSSADRRGGGGEGGLKAATTGELRRSRPGERVRLGILNCFPGTAGDVVGLATSSEFR